jgi:hypothetical protein
MTNDRDLSYLQKMKKQGRDVAKMTYIDFKICLVKDNSEPAIPNVYLVSSQICRWWGNSSFQVQHTNRLRRNSRCKISLFANSRY